MRLFWCGLFVGMVAVLGCGRSTEPGPSVEQNKAGDRARAAENGGADTALNDLIVGQPVAFENMTVFPVLSQQPREDDDFITLDEGLAAGTVEVFEIGATTAANEAPAVQIHNAAPARQTVENNEAVAQTDAAPSSVATNARGSSASQPEAGDLPNRQPQQSQQAQQLQLANVRGHSAQVNRLMIVNKSDKPLYLMPGEIVVGGKQDRTIGREAIVQADGKPVPVEVFCVEQGRWRQRGHAENQEILAAGRDGETPAEAVEELSQQANQGKFVKSVGVLSKAVRQAAQQDRAQGKVWEKVQEANAKARTTNPTGAFTRNYVQQEAVARLEPYLKKLEKPVSKKRQIVGVIVAINGKIEAIDVFDSTPLFRKMWPKLLKSFALDAASSLAEAKADPINVAAARKFLQEADSAHVVNSEAGHGTEVSRRESDEVVSFSARITNARARAVHISGYAK